ncbi:hypothetical protein JG688_00010198 [Phytophthora aleatoria]|nr:hypothetical protein JG688_00010198 [Phytophthora aleatoria]
MRLEYHDDKPAASLTRSEQVRSGNFSFCTVPTAETSVYKPRRLIFAVKRSFDRLPSARIDK